MARLKWSEALEAKNVHIDRIVAGRIKAAGEAGLVLADLVTDIAKGSLSGSRITVQEVAASIVRLKNKNLVVEEP